MSLSKVAEAVVSTKSGISRIKARLRVKGEEVTVKGDFGKGRKEPAIEPRQAAWLMKEASVANPLRLLPSCEGRLGPTPPSPMSPSGGSGRASRGRSFMGGRLPGWWRPVWPGVSSTRTGQRRTG